MVLAQSEIRAALESAQIVFDPPLEPRQLKAASVDLRLGTLFTKLHSAAGIKLSVHNGLPGLTALETAMELPPRNAFGQVNSFCLEPGEFILAMTYERVTLPNNLIALVEGRSTYARLGVSVHQTAPWIQPGWSGPIVLEIKNHGPMTIELTPLLDRPCQLTFFQLSSGLPQHLAYGAGPSDAFANQTHPLVDRRKEKPHLGASNLSPSPRYSPRS
jgi:dCTP deaminase